MIHVLKGCREMEHTQESLYINIPNFYARFFFWFLEKVISLTFPLQKFIKPLFLLISQTCNRDIWENPELFKHFPLHT